MEELDEELVVQVNMGAAHGGDRVLGIVRQPAGEEVLLTGTGEERLLDGTGAGAADQIDVL
jgi:hypothetical protein